MMRSFGGGFSRAVLDALSTRAARPRTGRADAENWYFYGEHAAVSISKAKGIYAADN